MIKKDIFNQDVKARFKVAAKDRVHRVSIHPKDPFPDPGLILMQITGRGRPCQHTGNGSALSVLPANKIFAETRVFLAKQHGYNINIRKHEIAI
jgi:hypothetical protein